MCFSLISPAHRVHVQQSRTQHFRPEFLVLDRCNTSAPWLCGDVLPVTPQFKTLDGSRGGCAQRCGTQNLGLKGSSMARSARPQGELYRAASATPCDESMCSRRRAPTSPPSDQRIRFSFAVEPNSVLLYWHKKHQRGGPLYEHNDILEVVLNKINRMLEIEKILRSSFCGLESRGKEKCSNLPPGSQS